MPPHFVKEEEHALPPLGLLPALARGEVKSEEGSYPTAILIGEDLKLKLGKRGQPF